VGLLKAVIVGGGIAGCSTAYYLAQLGHDVTLIERDSVAFHASGFAQGALNPVIRGSRQIEYQKFSDFSIGLHRQLAFDLSGHSSNEKYSNLNQKASVLLVKDEFQATAAKRIYESYLDDTDVDCRWLGLGELSHIDARISEDVVGGLYLGGAYDLDPYKFTLAIWQAAESLGANLVNLAVEGIAIKDGLAIGVRTSDLIIPADVVVIAAGPWTGGILNECGIFVPVSPLRGQILRLDAPDPPLKISFWWDKDYATSKPDGLVWVGTTEENVGFDAQTTEKARDLIIDSAIKMLPFLSQAKVVKQTACLRPMTPDNMPIIDSDLNVDGLVIASGGGRQGIALGPAIGISAAALVTGSEPPIDISGFSLSRFSDSK
tara:strand:- start:3535 stop:4659 length:1125 start_codon:yes stop_codon:yes gene_type:complete